MCMSWSLPYNLFTKVWLRWANVPEWMRLEARKLWSTSENLCNIWWPLWYVLRLMTYSFLCNVVSYHTIPYHTIPYHTIPYHTMPCHAMPCHAMPCHAMPCHATPYHAMPRHIIPRHVTPNQTKPHYTTLHHTPHNTTPHHIGDHTGNYCISYCTVRYGMVPLLQHATQQCLIFYFLT